MWTMPDLLKAAEDRWGNGKLVLKEDFEKVQAELATSKARITELEESAKADQTAVLTERVTSLETSLGAKEIEIKGYITNIETLQANYKTAAQQAQEQISRAGANAPVISDPPAQTKIEDGDGQEFTKSVQKKMASGLTKANAIAACVREFPAQHVAWLKSGKTSTI